MNRRSLLRHAAAALTLSPIAPVCLQAASSTSPNTAARRVRPSDPSWPDAASWERLNQQVGGQLIKVKSPLSACDAAPDSAACEKTIQDLKNPYFIGDQPGGMQSSGWVDAWDAAPSFYGVAARNTADMVAAVNFARENNLRLVIKGGGHS
jgi:hypothetical protein